MFLNTFGLHYQSLLFQIALDLAMSSLPALLLLAASIITPTLAKEELTRARRQGQEVGIRASIQGQEEGIRASIQGQEEVTRAISAVAEYNARLGAELGGKDMIMIIPQLVYLPG